MSKIKIKNFGPIKDGYKDASRNDLIDFTKVMILIGNQGSGKSTVAKVISTLTWMEKAINRGDIDISMSINDFQEHFNYQGIKGYFTDDTTIEYYGDAYTILYNLKDNQYPHVSENQSETYVVPKISYAPAERNFLSVIKNATGVKELPETLFDFAEELKLAQTKITEQVELPINNVSYKYDRKTDTSYIVGRDFEVDLLEASSGFQSVVPLFLVSRNLANTTEHELDLNSSNISVRQNIRLKEEISKIILDATLSDSEKIRRTGKVKAKFLNKCFINIVEEPEQNLFPSSQQKIINTLLSYNNMNDANKLIITTHSPYLINYITLSVKAKTVFNKVTSDELKTKLQNIVPKTAMINPEDLTIYELNENTGAVVKLKTYHGLPSDDNYLNQFISEGNQLFDSLLEIEEENGG